MKHFNPEIGIQKLFVQQILDALHSNILCEVRSHVISGHNSLFESKSFREGNCFKVEEHSLPDLYRICHEVIEALDFHKPIDFYLSGDADINAHAFESEMKDEPDLIEINSALFNLMTEDELKFVIGHEIGHLINHDMLVKSLVNFAYPDEDTIPVYIDSRRKILNHVAEFAADRYGYLANHNLEACISALYKLASGIDLQKLEVSIPALIENNEQHIKFFLEENGEMFGDHPVNPLRVQALYVYSTAKRQKEIDECICSFINCTSHKLFDPLKARYTAAAGMLMAQVDGKVSKREMAAIYKRMGEDCFFPDEEWKDLKKSDLNKVLDESIQQMLDTYGLRANESMMRYALEIMLADGTISQGEIDFAYELGDKLHLTPSETTTLITEAMRDNYLPKMNV